MDSPALLSAAPNRKSDPARRLRRAFWLVAPGLMFVVLIAAWGLAVHLFHIPVYILPAPLKVLSRIGHDWHVLLTNSVVTIEEILIGFGLSVVIGIPLGLLIAISAVAKRLVYPLLVFIQLVPKIAIAPLALVWFGFGIESKVVLTFLLTFFPLLLASISGFQILDQRFLYLTSSMGANGWQTFRYLRAPAALPVIFSGLKTSATIAATGAIVAEFVGANEGLGYELMQGTSLLDTELIFAVLLLLTVIGLALNYLVELVEFVLTPWQRKSK
jgi:NitT/TauT family transport system permease protein